MLHISYTLYGKKVDVAAASLLGAGYRESVRAAARLASPQRWITLTASSSLIAEPRHLLSASLYAAAAHISGRRIARYPEVELLLYLLGTRNIREALHEAGKPGERLGVVAVNMEGSAGSLIRSLAERVGATITPLEDRGEGWVRRYSAYLESKGYAPPRDREAILALLRARAALVRLSV